MRDESRTFTIRPARAEDRARVERLLAAADLPLDGIPSDLDGFAVAESGDALVGVAGLEVCCDNALLRSVAVEPSWRSAGVGRTLVERVIAGAESRRIHALYLLTTTAERYFPSFGFTPIDRADAPEDVRATAEFRDACPASATVMKKELARR